jgi:hypothetical protein
MNRKMFKALLVLTLVFVPFSNLMAWDLIQPTKKSVAELMDRWNFEAKGTKFEWNDYDFYPHPTFHGGSAAAYKQYSEVLVRFLSKPENVKFLKDAHLRELPLRYIFPTSFTSFGTFLSLAHDFSSHYLVPEKLQKEIRAHFDELSKNP